MPSIRILSAAEQVAAHIRDEIAQGRWTETIPGIHQLAGEFGVNPKTVKAGFDILEQEGLLIPRGAGRRRSIELSGSTGKTHSLRIAILTGDAEGKRQSYMLQLLHGLLEAGHDAFFASGSLDELRMDLKKVVRLEEKTKADAWIVHAGSREIVEWFSRQSTPSFALFGRRRGLPIASIGPNKDKATVELTRRLIKLGHRRIVLLCRKARRLPAPGTSERAFLHELETHGITPGAYNLPDWEETAAGLHQCLESLFRVTPPTALIVDQPAFLIGAMQFLGREGIRVPEDVSLIATDPDPSFLWCQPSVAHLHWDSRPWIRRVIRWAADVSRGKDDRRQTFTKAEFVDGGTVSPASSKGGSFHSHQSLVR